MAVKKGSKAAAEAAKKRSIARRFNDLMTRQAPSARATDQRTVRRLERYRKELKQGHTSRNRELSPLDIARRVNALLEHGERIADLRKLSKPRKIGYDQEELVELLQEMHPVYGFRPDAYRFAGITNETLVGAGILDKLPKKRGPKPKKKAATKPKRKPAKRARKK